MALLGIEDRLEQVLAAGLLADHRQVRADLAADAADRVALETLHVVLDAGGQELLAALGVALARGQRRRWPAASSGRSCPAAGRRASPCCAGPGRGCCAADGRVGLEVVGQFASCRCRSSSHCVPGRVPARADERRLLQRRVSALLSMSDALQRLQGGVSPAGLSALPLGELCPAPARHVGAERVGSVVQQSDQGVDGSRATAARPASAPPPCGRLRASPWHRRRRLRSARRRRPSRRRRSGPGRCGDRSPALQQVRRCCRSAPCSAADPATCRAGTA